MLGILIVVAIISFLGGSQYGKHHANNTSATSSNRLASTSGGFGPGGGARGGFNRADRVVGSVTAISASSITIDDSMSGTSKTLAITSSTQISDNGQTVTYSDIQTGDTVFATEDSSNTSNASRILVNPSFGGPDQGQSGASSQNSSSQNVTTN